MFSLLTRPVSELLERLQSAVAGRYIIEREIGHGGFATVYLARDIKHGRAVAVKVLRAELAAAVGNDRFLREIEIASRLQHPHILPLYDSGDAEGVLHYVMPFVEGESLRDRLTRERQLTVEEAIRIGCEVGSALSYAHGQGLIHRDIKPENILLSGGHAMVADFGIARAINSAGGSRLTETGLSVGTPLYASPEQAMASRELDGRSDLYSLACVLYEMLAGEPPFMGPNAQAIIARHTLDPVRPIRTVRPAVPEHVERAIVRALAKTPADRYTTMGDFLAALQGTGTTPVRRAPARRLLLAGVAAGAIAIAAVGYGLYTQSADSDATAESGPRRIVVMPFLATGMGSEQFLGDGVTEEIMNRLGTVDQLQVIARTSAMQYRNTKKRWREIGRELDVQFALAGEVSQRSEPGSAAQLVVSAELVRIADETRVWGKRFVQPRTNLFEVQSQIASQVVDELDIALNDPERTRLSNRPTENQDAWDAYLRGNGYYNRSWARYDVEAALRMYQRSVQLDPGFALGWAALGRTHAWMHQLNYDAGEARLRSARAAVDTALALGPGLAESHSALAVYHYWGRRNYDSALVHFGRAQEIRPNDAAILTGIGNVRRRQGLMDEALKMYRHAARVDPRSHVLWHNQGETYALVRSFPDARRALSQALAITPDFLDAAVLEAAVIVHESGNVDSARAVLDELAKRTSPTRWRAIVHLWRLGLFRIADRTLPEALARLAPQSYGIDSLEYYLSKADRYRLAERPAESRQLYDSARALALDRIEQFRTLPRYHGDLGVAYAGLGRKAEAIAEARRAVQMLPLQRDGLDAPDWIINLARVYTMVGEHGAALDELERVLAIPSRMSARWLRADPEFAVLRGEPRFQKLVAEPAR